MYVFVYGTLKSGLSNSFLLDGSKFIEAVKLYIPYKMVDLGNYPALVPSKKNMSIHGEIYEINSETLQNLDILEGVPEYYKRKLLKHKGREIWYYYLPDDTYQSKDIKSGKWK